ncbi:MAG TPA: hypothetical protein VMW52_07375 [Phycisphaerae bacterium]|nr:hypothetical protein [Phycisphaerae bacterium]
MPTPPPRQPSETDRRDQQLAAAALRKQQLGERPSRDEAAALRRVMRAREEVDRWKHYSTVPKKDYADLAGRQQKVLNEQAARYGIPIGGPTIDLVAVFHWLHDFLARNARKLTAGDDDDPMMAGCASPWLEKYRREKTLLARLDRKRREGDLLERDTVHEALGRIASILRGAGDTLQRQFGVDAHRVLEEALDDADREIAAAFVRADEAPQRAR